MNVIKFSLFVLCLVFFSCGLNAIKTVANLPSILNENSGMENLEGSDYFWMLNDSGNTNQLFKISENGKIKRKLSVINAKNKDWEDLASDGKNKLFIGDFGNNVNKRKDLVIYTVDLSMVKDEAVHAQKTEFVFEDQKKFPPKKKNRNFDVEAFIYAFGNFYLFTKNRSSHFNGLTKLYKIPALPGEFIAEKIGEFKICDNPKTCLITSADITNDNKKLVLLTHNALFVFTDFTDDYFFKGKLKTINLNHTSQKEAVCFKNKTIYFSDESSKVNMAKLYVLKFPLNKN